MVTAERIERTTLKNLLHNEEYARKVLPFLRPEYYEDRSERVVFSEIQKFYNEEKKQYESINKGNQSTLIDSDGKVNTPEFAKVAQSYKGKSSYK